MSKSTRNHGFTIVELLIVIVVIGILAALVIVTFRGAIGRAQEASLQNDLRNGVNSIKAFHAVNGRFPTTVSHCPAPSGDSVCVKSSEGNGFVYVHDNSVTPNTFRLTAYNDTVAYRATENESAKKVARPGIATFNYTGSMQSWSVPAGISTLKLDVWGAQGGGSSGGLGGFASGELSVTSGDSLYVYVGGAGKDGPASQNVTGGWNGGGHAAQVDSATYGASGGGASDVRMAGTSFANRILVAGGGGGKGNIAGGAGGGAVGIQGVDGGFGGRAGTQTAGGAASLYGGGQAGSFGIGGNTSGNGGGGGGGWYGGGSSNTTGGGGGGSGYIGGVDRGLMHTGIHRGDGKVIIIWNY